MRRQRHDYYMLFSDEALDFLYINRITNSREWFLQHKEQYRTLVVQPLACLTEYLSPAILSIDPLIVCTPKIGKCISRIYRDTRFSADKSIYRDVAWCCFMRPKQLYGELPGFFFEFSPRFARWGAGYYCASREAMENLRSMIAINHPLFVKTADMAKRNPAFKLDGESYKRPKRPDLTPLQQDYINRKTVCFTRTEDISVLQREDLPQLLERDFLTLAPAYELFMAAEGHK